MAAQNAEKRYFLTEQNGHCIQQVTDVPGIFALVFREQSTGTFGTEIKRTPIRVDDTVHRYKPARETRRLVDTAP
jgi:hypothetical protein